MLKLGKISDDLLKEYFNKVEEHLNAKFTKGKNSLHYVNNEIEKIENNNSNDFSRLNELNKKKIIIENYKKQIENTSKFEKIEELIKCQNISEIINNNLNYFKELEDIYKYFDWDNFRANKERKKVFKKIINELEVKVCPYCGRNHIDAIEVKDENDEKIVIPCLDHFWAKGAKTKEQKDKEEKKVNCSDLKEQDINKYAQYQLSIYNLIPSCYQCNSQFKQDKDVEDQAYKILYPYKEGFEDNIKFNFLFETMEEQKEYINSLTGVKKAIKDVKIGLVKRKKIKINNSSLTIDEENDYLKKCRNSNKMFHLEEIYNEFHHQNAVDLVNKYVWFKKSYLNSFKEILSNTKKDHDKLKNIIEHSPILTAIKTYIESIKKADNKTDLKKILDKDFNYLFGNWYEPNNDLKEPLSKFYRDIYEQITDPQIYKPLMENSEKGNKSN